MIDLQTREGGDGMESSEILAGSIAYIEQHLREELTVELLADMAGFSPYYFCRLFTLHAGMPVMEYIRRRRLAFAASDICAGKRILDVAFDYGFESHAGFAKAFRKVYGYSPDTYRRRVGPHRPAAPNPLKDLPRTEQPFVPTVQLRSQPGFYIAGTVLRTSAELSSIAQQPALWNRMQIQEEENRIYAMASPTRHGEYYLSFPVGQSLFRLVTGVRVEDPAELEGGLYVDWVPPGFYGVFSPPPVFGDRDAFAEAVIRTWRYIYDTWLPGSGWQPDSAGLDYEYYDERCHGDGPYTMDVCIPLSPITEK